MLINQNGCNGRYGQEGASVRIIPPDERDALSVDLPADERRIGLCDAGDPGNVVHVSPMAATLQETTTAS